MSWNAGSTPWLLIFCSDCLIIAEIAVGLLRLQIFRNLHIRLVILPRVGEVAWVLPQGNWTRMIELVRMQGVLSDCWYFSLNAYWLLRLQSDCWDCSLIVEIEGSATLLAPGVTRFSRIQLRAFFGILFPRSRGNTLSSYGCYMLLRSLHFLLLRTSCYFRQVSEGFVSILYW